MATQKVIDLYKKYLDTKKDVSAAILLRKFPELKEPENTFEGVKLEKKKEVKKDGKKSKG